MFRFFFKIIVITLGASLLLFSCKGLGNKKITHPTDPITNQPLKYDTSKTAIIPFDGQPYGPFEPSLKPAAITQDDLTLVDSLLAICVAAHNRSVADYQPHLRIDYANGTYRKQLVAVTNGKGEKEIWVNAFCHPSVDNWKTQILMVDDGGACYFNCKINTASRSYSEFSVNGPG